MLWVASQGTFLAKVTLKDIPSTKSLLPMTWTVIMRTSKLISEPSLAWWEVKEPRKARPFCLKTVYSDHQIIKMTLSSFRTFFLSNKKLEKLRKCGKPKITLHLFCKDLKRRPQSAKMCGPLILKATIQVQTKTCNSWPLLTTHSKCTLRVWAWKELLL